MEGRPVIVGEVTTLSCDTALKSVISMEARAKIQSDTRLSYPFIGLTLVDRYSLINNHTTALTSAA